MKSLYDILGARAGDDAQAIKKAFRTAVKAHHPDLHPDDPDAVLRFRRIITANTILRDDKQRAAYDQLLDLERQQLKLKLGQQFLQLQHQRRQTRLKLGATVAVAAVCAAAGSYGLLMPMPTTAVIEVMKDKPQAAKTTTIVETIKKDKVAVLATASPVAARVSETAPAAVIVDAARDDAGDVPASTGAAPAVATAHVAPADATSIDAALARREEAGASPTPAEGARATARDGATTGADRSDDAPRPAPASSAAEKGDKDRSALADLAPAPRHNASFYHELGTASYRVGDFPSAIVNLDEAIRLDPNDAKAYNIRGNAWDEIGFFANALADYDAAIRIDPNNPVFFHDRAIMWHRRGDLDKALVDLDRAVRFTFSDPNIYCDRGLIWYEKGSHARAVADFNHAAKVDPDFTAAYISRGLILHRNSEFNVAFSDLGKTIRVSPSVFDVTKRIAAHP